MPLIPRETALQGLKQAEDSAKAAANQIRLDVESGDYSLAISRLDSFKEQLEALNNRANRVADIYGN